MAKILVTGGPVHAKLDAVKIVTNRFKGRRIMVLALLLAKKGHDVIYLGPKHGIPVPAEEGMALTNVGHDGFLNYMEMVEHLSRGGLLRVQHLQHQAGRGPADEAVHLRGAPVRGDCLLHQQHGAPRPGM